MLTLTVEGFVNVECGRQYTRIAASGETAEEIFADAARQVPGIKEMSISGACNTRQAYEGLFGPQDVDAYFMGDELLRAVEPEPPRRPWWKLW